MAAFVLLHGIVQVGGGVGGGRGLGQQHASQNATNVATDANVQVLLHRGAVVMEGGGLPQLSSIATR